MDVDRGKNWNCHNCGSFGHLARNYRNRRTENISQIRYSLVVILELSGVSKVQYKDVKMINDGKYQ